LLSVFAVYKLGLASENALEFNMECFHFSKAKAILKDHTM